MASSVELDVSYRIGNAPVRHYPFPHLYVSDIFPREFYANLQKHMPPPGSLKPIGDLRPVHGFNERFVLPLDAKGLATLPQPFRAFWEKLAGWMISARFANLLFQKFAPIPEARLKTNPDFEWYDEALLVEDHSRYSLGPHTDTPEKLVSALFYLPADDSLAAHGTSIYVPKEAGFTCPGGPHHPFDRFERMATMPFLPNTLFAFVKTLDSFHGVEPIAAAGVRRHLLLYDLRFKTNPVA